MSLGMRPRGTPEPLQERRWRAIAMIQAGHGATDVARRLKVDPRRARRWKADDRRRSASGLRARPASGRPPKLSDKERRTLRQASSQGRQGERRSHRAVDMPAHREADRTQVRRRRLNLYLHL